MVQFGSAAPKRKKEIIESVRYGKIGNPKEYIRPLLSEAETGAVGGRRKTDVHAGFGCLKAN
ncbi:hypothetical protein ALCH109712_14125 [Alkalicoccus chagannorensis]